MADRRFPIGAPKPIGCELESGVNPVVLNTHEELVSGDWHWRISCHERRQTSGDRRVAVRNTYARPRSFISDILTSSDGGVLAFPVMQSVVS